MARAASPSMFTAELLGPAIGDSFVKLDPRTLIRNPVMFVTAVVALLVTAMLVAGIGGGSIAFKAQLVFWLWLTVIFGNFAEALAEGRGKAQAASLRATKGELTGKRVGAGGAEIVAAAQLRVGDIVLVENGDLVPADGEVVEGVASVNEAAITGESAPVIREGGGDRSAVTAGTRVVSDWLRVRVTAGPGQGFLDRMIALVEGAERQKTPNEIALTILLVGLTIIFLIAVGTVPMFAGYAGGIVPVVILSALLITLIPTTIAALLSAIGLAGMDRLVRFNVLAKSGRAVEAAGDIDVLLLDKTGTITIGDRQASEFKALAGVRPEELAEAALLASLADETPEGRSIVGAGAREVQGRHRRAARRCRGDPVHRTDAHLGRENRRFADREGRGRLDPQGAIPASATRPPPPNCAASRTRLRAAAAPRSPSRWTASSSARSSSRTSSRPASANASASCARWASAP